MAEETTRSTAPEESEVTAYVEQHLGSYVTDLEAALEATTASGSDYTSIARPMQQNHSEVEKLGQDRIFESLKEQFLPRYPGRVMIKNFYVEHEGKKAKDMVPPAYAFEVIRFFVPQKGGKTPSGGSDTRVSLIH